MFEIRCRTGRCSLHPVTYILCLALDACTAKSGLGCSRGCELRGRHARTQGSLRLPYHSNKLFSHAGSHRCSLPSSVADSMLLNSLHSLPLHLWSLLQTLAGLSNVSAQSISALRRVSLPENALHTLQTCCTIVSGHSGLRGPTRCVNPTFSACHILEDMEGGP